jgi:peptidoglycan-associated lipoprotein
MRKSLNMFAVVAMVSLSLLFIAGCKCKGPNCKVPGGGVTPGDGNTGKDVPPPPASPRPTIALTVSPTRIDSGQTTTLSWSSSNATGINIDNNVGTVEPSGSRTVSPDVSTTYKAVATGPGGSATSEARVTVAPVISITPSKNGGEDGGPKQPPPFPPGAKFDANVKDVYFDYDQYSIREDARAALQANIRLLNELPSVMITIGGHCDERGSDKYNQALGDRRANAVKEYLVSQGISASRIDTISYGSERPFCEEHNEECWQLNRRAHFSRR